MLCMGASKKAAKGPNPLSIKRKVINKDKTKEKKVKKRRFRKGKRSKELSALKRKEAEATQQQSIA